jgi:hypothetical protein
MVLTAPDPEQGRIRVQAVPLVKTPEEVGVVHVAGKLPVNVLAGWPGFRKRQLGDLGVKRISVGGALARRLGRVHARREGHRGERAV